MVGRDVGWKNQLCLMKLGAPVNVKGRHGMTPFMFAASELNSYVLFALLRRQADANQRDRAGNNALYYYVEKGGRIRSFHYYEEKKILETLIKVCNLNQQNKVGKTPLIRLSTLEKSNSHIMKYLLKHGADPNIQDLMGKTALDYAQVEVNKSFVKILLKAGARNGDGKIIEPEYNEEDERAELEELENV